MKKFLFLIGIVAFACSDYDNNEANKQDSKVTKVDTIQVSEQNKSGIIHIDKFSLHQTTVEGCSGLFRR
jgi:hypothetical protein